MQQRTRINGATVDSGFHVDAIPGQTGLGNSHKGARAIAFHGSCIARLFPSQSGHLAPGVSPWTIDNGQTSAGNG